MSDYIIDAIPLLHEPQNKVLSGVPKDAEYGSDSTMVAQKVTEQIDVILHDASQQHRTCTSWHLLVLHCLRESYRRLRAFKQVQYHAAVQHFQ